MRRAHLRSLLVAWLLVASVAAAAPPTPPPLTADDQGKVVADVTAALAETYVFPEVATKMGEHLRTRLDAGAYAALGDPQAFAETLTSDLQSISHDKHLRVFFDPEPPAEEGGPSPEERQARFRAQAKRDNYCFREAKRLAGNVGYLAFDCFMSADLGGDTAVAALTFLGGSDALIIDLRNNGGGSPSMIQLITSHLLGPEPTHLNSFYVRKGDHTEQFWTQAWVPGPRLVDVPVFVLTSGRTFSAAEEFVYNLKNLKRATLVGETTGGGAHPVEEHRVAGYPLAVRVPFGRAVNPITGTNWEGTGVEPDVAVAADQALPVAHARALAAIAEGASDPEVKATAAFVGGVVADRQRPVALTPAELQAYVGTYGPRTIELVDGVLVYRRGPGRALRLLPVGEDRFLVGDLDDFRLRFERGADGAVARIVGLYADGTEEPHARGDEG